MGITGVNKQKPEKPSIELSDHECELFGKVLGIADMAAIMKPPKSTKAARKALTQFSTAIHGMMKDGHGEKWVCFVFKMNVAQPELVDVRPKYQFPGDWTDFFQGAAN